MLVLVMTRICLWYLIHAKFVEKDRKVENVYTRITDTIKTVEELYLDGRKDKTGDQIMKG